MKKHLSVRTKLSGLLVALCAVGFACFQGCQKQDYSKEDDYLDPVLLQSPELEEYIIAGVEYQRALGIFQTEIKKVDLLNLEFVKGPDGKKVAYLPISVSIEDKAKNLNEKKNELFKKYPLFALLAKDAKNDYFRTCIKSSSDVNKKLLELGININQPMTKGGTSEEFSSMDDLINYLNAEMSGDTYREIVIVVYKDGRIVTYQDDVNTPTYYEAQFKKVTNLETGQSKYYYPSDTNKTSDEVAYMAHTQKGGNTPGKLDKEQAAKWDGLDMRIYNNGGFYQFDSNGLK